METMHAAGRRNLPPVPRAAAETMPAVEATPAAEATPDAEATPAAETTPATETTAAAEAMPDAGSRSGAVSEAAVVLTETPHRGAPLGSALGGTAGIDAGQVFVARLRAAAPAFAAAADAESAVVREAVPPARHRRSQCRVVLRRADGGETDLTFVGGRRRPGAGDADALDGAISEWLAAGQPRDTAWLVVDPDAPDGVAVDLTAWVSSSCSAR